MLMCVCCRPQAKSEDNTQESALTSHHAEAGLSWLVCSSVYPMLNYLKISGLPSCLHFSSHIAHARSQMSTTASGLFIKKDFYVCIYMYGFVFLYGSIQNVSLMKMPWGWILGICDPPAVGPLQEQYSLLRELSLQPLLPDFECGFHIKCTFMCLSYMRINLPSPEVFYV